MPDLKDLYWLRVTLGCEKPTNLRDVGLVLACFLLPKNSAWHPEERHVAHTVDDMCFHGLKCLDLSETSPNL